MHVVLYYSDHLSECNFNILMTVLGSYQAVIKLAVILCDNSAFHYNAEFLHTKSGQDASYYPWAKFIHYACTLFLKLLIRLFIIVIFCALTFSVVLIIRIPPLYSSISWIINTILGPLILSLSSKLSSGIVRSVHSVIMKQCIELC